MAISQVLLYSNREKEIEEYARLVRQADLPLDLTVCSSPEQVAQKIDQAEIVFGVHLPSDVYARAKKLRWIQSMWAGVEGLMQVDRLPADIIITKPWGVFGRFLSHYVFGNLLAQKIHFEKALQAQAQCQWS